MSVEWTGRIQVHHPDPGHRLVSDWQPGTPTTPSTHKCAGCGWEVTTHTKPNQATAAAVQAAYTEHLHIWACVIECDHCGATEAAHLPGGECPTDVEHGGRWLPICESCGHAEADHCEEGCQPAARCECAGFWAQQRPAGAD